MNDSIGMNYCAPDANVWAVNLDGRYMSAVQNYLVADGIPTDGVTKIVSNAAQTLSYCPDPEGIGKCQKTGIVIGKVQSGKTSNFISITALAFDNDYDIVIVLGGTKKPLVKQNRDRIKEYFSTTKDVLVLDTTDFKDQLTAQKMHQFRKMNKKVVIVALKSPAQINYIADNIFFDSVLAEKPILIIDDEGDEASLNTLVKKGKKSSTYKAIENLKERLDRHCFLSITATPQANLLIDTLDVLSPDFGILVDPGKGYCGLDVYHSDTTYTRKIPDSETSLLDDGIPQSFIDAISMFFVACAIYKNRGMKPGDKLSMLIHPSQLKADHEKVFKKVEGLINDWCQKSEDKRDIAYNPLKKILVAAYNEYTVGETKTNQGMRTIILPHSVTDILRRRKADAISQWIFPDPVKPEDPVDPNAAYRHMKTLLQRAGLPSIRFHDLRHPYVKPTTKKFITFFEVFRAAS